MKSRNTLQKCLVLEAAKTLFHPTADEIYNQIARAHPHISRSTVYRILGQMVEQNTLRRVMAPGTADRFDITLSEHYHVHCRVCGKVADAALPYQAHLVENTVDASGFLIEAHDIHIRGVCADCRFAKGETENVG